MNIVLLDLLWTLHCDKQTFTACYNNVNFHQITGLLSNPNVHNYPFRHKYHQPNTLISGHFVLITTPCVRLGTYTGDLCSPQYSWDTLAQQAFSTDFLWCGNRDNLQALMWSQAPPKPCPSIFPLNYVWGEHCDRPWNINHFNFHVNLVRVSMDQLT